MLSRLVDEAEPTKIEDFRKDEAAQWLRDAIGIASEPAAQAVAYIASEFDAIGVVPHGKEIVFERFFDESGGMQLVIHSPLGSRINRAWGLAMRKRF